MHYDSKDFIQALSLLLPQIQSSSNNDYYKHVVNRYITSTDLCQGQHLREQLDALQCELEDIQEQVTRLQEQIEYYEDNNTEMCDLIRQFNDDEIYLEELIDELKQKLDYSKYERIRK